MCTLRRVHYSFDFDYTLADSSTGAIECANYALRKIGLPTRSDAEIRKTIGLSLDHTFSQLVDSPTHYHSVQFQLYFLERADQVMLDCIRFFDCTGLVLKTLKRDGHYVSIVSTKFGARIRLALERDGLLDFVDAIFGGDDVARNKPDPEGLLAAIHKSQLPKEQTLYVGDSETDGECASSAGVGFIGVLSGQTDREQLSRWNPKTIHSDISGIISA